MKYRCSYNSDLRIVEAVTHGQAGITELSEMVCCIAELCAQKYWSNILVDHSELDAHLLSMEQIQKLANLVVSLKDNFISRKCAHVAIKDIQFGLVRAWEIMVELNGLSDIDFKKKVFRNRTDAIKWIQTSS